MNVAQFLFSSAVLFPERPVIIYKDEQMNYKEFLGRVLCAAKGLIRLGVKPGDRIAIYAENSIEWIVSEFAIWSAGGIMVPINFLYTSDEAKYIINHSEACTVILDRKTEDIVRKMKLDLPHVRHFVSLQKSEWNDPIWLKELMSSHQPLWMPVFRPGADGAVIYYTSGTTGRPKGCLLSHDNIHWQTALIIRAWHQPFDRFLVQVPLTFIMGSCQACLSCIQRGSTIILLDRFSPKAAFEAIQKYKVTLTMGVPTMYAMMANFADADKYDISSLRFIISGGSPLSPELAATFYKKFGVTLSDGYGLTEATPLAVNDMSSGHPEIRPGSCGHPLPGNELKIFDDNDVEVPTGQTGEVVVRSPLVMVGYYKDPEATAQALRGDWLHSGDLARFDEDGYLYIIGRKKELIKRGGINIFPSEIEDVLYAHPKVAEAAVVGTVDEIFGEQVGAAVVLKPGMSATLGEIREHCSKKLADYKVPQHIEFWQELPKGNTGKLLKREIQSLLQKSIKK